jgi:putative transposase
MFIFYYYNTFLPLRQKMFLENMSLAFDKSAVVKEYKTEIETLQKDKDLIAKKLGETIVEKEFLEGKLVSLVSFLNIIHLVLYYSLSSKGRKTFVDTELKISLITSVLNEALSLYPKPDIVNTDQGSQYTAQAHVDILKSHNIKISMDGKGRSIDNIVIERFWRSIKYEEIYLNDYKSMNELRYSIDNYMIKYNSRRLHSSIGNKTPNEVYFKAINNLDLKMSQKVS